VVWYLIENSPEREISQSQRWMYEPMVESGQCQVAGMGAGSAMQVADWLQVCMAYFDWSGSLGTEGYKYEIATSERQISTSCTVRSNIS
jgi:hypothetical protein